MSERVVLSAHAFAAAFAIALSHDIGLPCLLPFRDSASSGLQPAWTTSVASGMLTSLRLQDLLQTKLSCLDPN